MKCTCDIVFLDGGILGEEVIEYCPTHKAAPDLLEALRDSLKFVDLVIACNEEISSELLTKAITFGQEIGQAIAKAEGE